MEIPADDAASADDPISVLAIVAASSESAPQYHWRDDISAEFSALSSIAKIDAMLILIADISAAVIPVPADSIRELRDNTRMSAAGNIPTADIAPASRHPIEIFIQSSVSIYRHIYLSAYLSIYRRIVIGGSLSANYLSFRLILY